MPYSLDLGDDWRIIDDTRTVTFFQKTSTAAPTTGGIEVEAAFRTAVDKDEAAKAPDLLAKGGTAWHLWAAKLGVVTPKVGDVIADNGVRWTVVSWKECDEGQRFRCACVRER